VVARPSDGDTPVYATAWAVTPGADFGLYLRAGRVLFGVRLGAGYILGQVPSPAPVQTSDGLTTYTASDPLFGAFTGEAAGVMEIGL
jgi:hypothetical protein